MLSFRELRSFLVTALIGAFGLVLQTPPCAPEICSMDQATMASACDPLESDCCQTSGERVAHSSFQLPAPDPCGFVARVAEMDREAAPESLLAAPAVLQGVGLHTLFSVFLI